MTPAPGSGWPLFRYDTQRTGHTPHAGPTDRPTIIWTQPFTHAVSYVVHDETVYAVEPNDSILYAFDIKTGQRLWNHTLDEGTQTFLALNPSADTLISVSDTCTVNQFTLEGTHRNRWQFEQPLGALDISVLLTDETLFLLRWGATPLHIDLSSGEATQLVDTAWVDGIAYDDGDIFLLSGGAIGSFETTSMAFKWEQTVHDQDPEADRPKTDPTGYRSTYVGVSSETVYALINDSLTALDRNTGVERWHEPHDGAFPPAITEQTVYKRVDGAVAAMDTETRSEKWRFDTGRPLVPPVAADDMVYTGEYVADNARLFGLDAANGDVVWEQSGLEDLYWLLVADGTLVAKCGSRLAALR